jgi:hypothetical protein
MVAISGELPIDLVSLKESTNVYPEIVTFLTKYKKRFSPLVVLGAAGGERGALPAMM